MDALLTSGCSRMAYSAMRSLCSLGLKVAVTDTSRLGMSQWSRFCAGSYLNADPFSAPKGFIRDLRCILKDSGAGFLLPVMQETEVIAKYRDSLPDGVVLPLASYEKIHMANDKGLMAAYARKMGVKVPKVIEWSTWDELEERLRDTGYQVVVKLRTGFSARGVFYPEGPKEAVALCKGLTAAHSLDPEHLPIVQRRVKGESWGVACLYHEGKKLASFTYRMLREIPTTGGVATLRVSARNREMENCAYRLLDGLGWHGLAMIDFKFDPESEEVWFMEINPRLWAAIGHAVASGVDFVKLLYISLNEGPDKAMAMSRPQRLGVVSRWWGGDVSLALSEARNGRFLKTMKLVIPGGADHYDEFPRDDRAASAGMLAQSLYGVLQRGKKRSGTRWVEAA